MKRRYFLAGSTLVGAELALNSRSALASASVQRAPTIAEQLYDGMIWCTERPRVAVRLGDSASDIAYQDVDGVLSDDAFDLHAAFAKETLLEELPIAAQLHVFAYSRYRLYLNGRYIGRGPGRFQNQRPEYDSWEVGAVLVTGCNVIQVLAHRDAPTGRIMLHEPGMAALLVWQDQRHVAHVVSSDESWHAQPERSFASREVAWASIQESIDARLTQDWTRTDFDFSDWHMAVKVGGKSFAPLWPRTIPPLRETALPWVRGTVLPQNLSAGMHVELTLETITLAYHRLDFVADDGSEIEVTYELPDNARSGRNHYIARAGWQRYEGGDTFAFKTLTITVLSGTIRIASAVAIEVLYPFDCIGRFECSDASLNQLWALSARSLLVLSEDAYVDCGDRERVEWTDNTPPAFECTRVMMTGPGPDGGHRYGDPRLLKALLQRIALTQQSDGQIKAHSCSERWDIHAIMEDRSCGWVIALREYVDCSDDVDFLRAMWPTVTRLLQWFLERRTARGLVQAREWEVWDNPLRYQICEGAGLNAWVYRALVDAAWLGEYVGFGPQAQKFAAAARALSAAFDQNLWDEVTGAYFGGLFGAGSKLNEQLNGKLFAGPIVDGHYRATLQAALFALESGIVPPGRRERVIAFIRTRQGAADSIMSHFLLFKALYAIDDAVSDTQVLSLMRSRWCAMLQSPWQTSWEDFEGAGGSKLHIYGIVPSYFLSAWVLGVRVEGAVRDGLIRIEPRCGDLSYAQGVVVTEFGPVSIAWERVASGAMSLHCNVPPNCKALLRLPPWRASPLVSVDGLATHACIDNGKPSIMLEPGQHDVLQMS